MAKESKGRYMCNAAGGHPCRQTYKMKGNPNEYCWEHYDKIMQKSEYA